MNVKLEEAEAAGERSNLKNIANAVRAAVEGSNRREQSLNERESQLTAELAIERANLADLNNRLEALEREMLMNTDVDKVKENKKR